MKIAVCSSFTPFGRWGNEVSIENLNHLLEGYGHHVEHVRLPLAGEAERLMPQFAAYRWVDLSAADRIICFAPAAHLIPHPRKIVWFARSIVEAVLTPALSQTDLTHGARSEGLVRAVEAAERAALREARRVWAESREASEQLSSTFGITADVLRPLDDPKQLDMLLS